MNVNFQFGFEICCDNLSSVHFWAGAYFIVAWISA